MNKNYVGTYSDLRFRGNVFEFRTIFPYLGKTIGAIWVLRRSESMRNGAQEKYFKNSMKKFKILILEYLDL